ncbi:hypothetical protein ACFWHQ_40885 [Streptomyces sp. NPDC060334]|uniref:hypothetical protein n=1 Tax=unclassified Streptomyces TaxID=2593676 RepID=UPI0006AFED07|nr:MULTISPECIES: hypothetical protein [unclassified Streptomyces]KOU37858.1 hypothetical protein ADK55_35485 [Streptomyces sp. WM4235]MCX5078334.1 hypothetical protein [Streptomyces sp. NBC_00424]
MPTSLPIPIEFRLPEGWLPARTKGDDPGVAFAALHPRPDAGFAANITIEGGYPPEVETLTELASESAERLGETAESLTVADRREFDSAGVPALTQRLVFSVVTGDVHRDLVQSQVYLSVIDTEEPRKRAVIRLVLTATAAQHDRVLGDFQEFLRSVRAGTGKAA